MNKENVSYSQVEEPSIRITRARAKTLGSSVGLPPRYPSVKQDEKRDLRTKTKRAGDDNKPANSLKHKKRAVLKDVTNIFCGTSTVQCVSATKVQPSKQDKTSTQKKGARVGPAPSGKGLPVQENVKNEPTDETKVEMMEERQESVLPANSKELSSQRSRCIKVLQDGRVEFVQGNGNSTRRFRLKSLSQRGGKVRDKDCLDITDIDSKHKDPLMCGLYAPDIYQNLHATELERRPSIDYMDKLQRDVTQGMRAILVDWLVEVSEEYKLVPDTLYLTVNLIDRFLSENYIEKQKLQLLGVTCMLIASKYEEICAPRVEEFCFITDNTYTKDEVVKMESRVLNFLGFHLSVPTTKKFLRRFIQAAQVSYKVPSVELEFLSNYLAELTLVEYSFLKFLPSLIAASAVFLARWTLDQSAHPWNPTLEHYTSYKASDLKITVQLLQDLQLNTKGCTLHSIREKYKQQKFKCVAALSSQKVQSLF